MNKYQKLYNQINNKYRKISDKKTEEEKNKNKIKLDIIVTEKLISNIETNIEHKQEILNNIKIANKELNFQKELFERRKKENLKTSYLLGLFGAAIFSLTSEASIVEFFISCLITHLGTFTIGTTIDFLQYCRKTNKPKQLFKNYDYDNEKNNLELLHKNYKHQKAELKNKQVEIDIKTKKIAKLEELISRLIIQKSEILYALELANMYLGQENSNKEIDRYYENDANIARIRRNNYGDKNE